MSISRFIINFTVCSSMNDSAFHKCTIRFFVKAWTFSSSFYSNARFSLSNNLFCLQCNSTCFCYSVAYLLMNPLRSNCLAGIIKSITSKEESRRTPMYRHSKCAYLPFFCYQLFQTIFTFEFFSLRIHTIIGH